ncbi:MAG: hypothetical protein ACR2PT_10350 [Endozoicomonas sp.]
MAGRTEAELRIARILQSFRYTHPSHASQATNAWNFLGTKGAEGLAELDRRNGIYLGAGSVPPCPGASCSHHYRSPNFYSRELEERQRQQIRDAEIKLEELRREGARRMQEQVAESQRWMAEQDRKRVEAMQFHQQQLAGLGSMVITTAKTLSRLKPATAAVLKQFGHSIDDLVTAANKPINKEGLTEAARALTKHAAGQRGTGTFPKLTGGIEKQNKAAREIKRPEGDVYKTGTGRLGG